MWSLYQNFYQMSALSKFKTDLYKKTHCFIGRDQKGAIRGFSVFKFYQTIYRGKKINILYTGDTMFHPDYWGNKSLHVAFITFCVKQIISRPFQRVYWHLISSGIRTYMSMARSTADYFPCHDRPTPDWEQGLIHHVSQQEFSSNYDPTTGLIKLTEKNEGIFNSELTPIDKTSLGQPEIEFFLQKNPNYKIGIELSCIAQIGFKTFFFVLYKIVKSKVRTTLPAKLKHQTAFIR